MTRLRTLLLAALLLVPALALAEVYKWTDANGQVHYGDAPAPTAKAKKLDLEINTFKGVKYNLPPPKPAAPARRRVVMYATAWCGYCKKARAHFAARGIPYTEYDIEKDAAANAEHQRLGGRGVPLIQIGSELMHGFDAGSFDRAYGK